MYKLLPFVLLFFGFSAISQETLYLANGNSFAVKLTEATEEAVKYNELKGDRVLKRSFRRENVLIAFSAAGEYLLIANLSPDAATATQQIVELYNKPASGYDIIVKANPLTAIVGTISYESDELFNYKTSKGQSGSINKSEVALVIYRDGRHEFGAAPPDVVPMLQQLTPQIEQLKRQPPVQAAPIANEPKSVPVTTPNEATAAKSGKKSQKPSLNEEQLMAYREESLRRVDEFVQYLNIITNKSLEAEEKDKAIDEAAKLFLPNATIQVTSVNWSGIKTYPIRQYLSRLKLLPYNSTKIEWHEVNYVSELTQAADGNYYGMISGTQTFTGYGEGGSDDVMYSDVTRKNVKVKLESYKKNIDGQKEINWKVLLGNIGIAQDQ
ncbi:MAG: hypothetical protein ACK4GN_04140 [Runella sp.]